MHISSSGVHSEYETLQSPRQTALCHRHSELSARLDEGMRVPPSQPLFSQRSRTVWWLPATLALLCAALALADVVAPNAGIPVRGGLRVVVELPHIPPDGLCRISLDGSSLYSDAFGQHVVAAAPAEKVQPGAHTLSVYVYDPQFKTRCLYTGSATIVKPPAVASVTPAPADAAVKPADTTVVFGLDGVGWGMTPPPENDARLWDTKGRLLSTVTGAAVQEGVVVGTHLANGAMARSLVPGDKGLEVEVTIANATDRPMRVLSCDLRFRDVTGTEANCLATALGPRPALVAPGGKASQLFRVDTFDDTSATALRVEPVVAVVVQAEDLLTDGGFEKPVQFGDESPSGEWQVPTAIRSGVKVEGVPADAAACRSLATVWLDWQNYSQVQMANPSGANINGQGYVRAAFSEAPKAVTPVLIATLSGLKQKTDYVFGCGSWGGDSASVQLLDGKGQGLAGQRRNFSGFWWRQDVPNWTERALIVSGAEGVETANVVLSSLNQVASWDACYFVAKESIRLAKVADSLRLEIKPGNGEKTGPSSVVYLGEDRETRGNWIGNYGSYCWALCAMSAPRDMVGGLVTPLKCKDTTFTASWNNEVVRVRGKGDFRYTSWAGNPSDPQTRHWIGAMRTDERRAPENPQWGERTYASWDDHGELHPTDGWGSDLFVTLHMPEGLWKLSLYFVDWDWYGAPFPRDHRVALSAAGDAKACNTRVADFEQGVYKVFGVRGGRDITIRLHKDRSAAVLLSGIFLDPLTKPRLHVAGVPLDAGLSSELQAFTNELEAEGTGALRQTQLALPELARKVDAAASSEPARRQPPLQRLRTELWERVPGADKQTQVAFQDYVSSLVATTSVQRAAEQLQTEADAFFVADALAQAEWRYDAAAGLLAKQRQPMEDADVHRTLAAKFRVVHPLYAQAQVRQCAESVTGLVKESRITYLRGLAVDLFALATQDWTAGRAKVRVPYALAEFAYRQLLDVVGYDHLTPEERTNLMLCCQRQTWYTLGWDRLAAEQERLMKTIPPEKVGGVMLNDLVRTYAVLAQSDPTYVEKAAKQCEEMRKHRPDGDWALDSYFRMAQIYYNLGMWAKARDACQAVVDKWPDSPECKETQRLLTDMKDR